MTDRAVTWTSARIEGRTYVRPRQAVILAGGRGTRMRPLTDTLPKPMVPILGRPFLEYQIEQLRDQGFTRILLLLGYLPHVVQDYFGDGSKWGVQIEYSVTEPDQLTGSRVSTARHLIDPCFLLLYCDNYWPFQFDRLWARFCEAGRPALITTYANEDNYSRGCVSLDSDGNVEVFDRLRQAPNLKEVEISYAIITDLALELLPADDMLFEEAIYTPLARQHRLAAYVTNHRYYSVGSLDRIPTTEAFFRRSKTLLLDRDGVLNRKPDQGCYVRNWSEWSWREGALRALRELKKAGYQTIIISNQAGVGRGVMTASDLEGVHQRMMCDVVEAGGKIDAIYCCPHHWEENCECRKPKPGLFYRAQRDFHLDLTRCAYVGDDERDAAAAAAAGCPFHLVTPNRSLLDVVEQTTKEDLYEHV